MSCLHLCLSISRHVFPFFLENYHSQHHLFSPPQLSLGINPKERSLEFQAKGQEAEFVSAVFSGKGVSSLFNFKWHKMILSVQSQVVSIHIDCSYISSKPLLPQRGLLSEGNAFIGLDAVKGTPVSVSHSGGFVDERWHGGSSPVLACEILKAPL